MKENKTKPDIRFKGFTEAWEQRKLGEVVEFYNGDRSSRYPTDSDIVPDGIPFINAGDLVSGRVKLDTANKITKEKYNELSGAKIQRGDIIYCLRGTLGKNAFIDNFDSGTVASSLVDIRPKKIVGKYLFQVLNSDIEYRQRTINDEGAAQPNLSAKNLSLFDIPMSNKDEQTKIAEYFSNLDNLITLHQRECDHLKELKKSMLKKMFPRDGSSFPEVRFAGFTDAWEQRKVFEIGNIITGSTPKTSISDNYGGEFLFVSPADIQGNRYVDETITTLTKKGFDQGRKIREKASLFVSIGSTIGKVAQTSQESTTNQQINAVEPYDNFDDDFVFTSLQNISNSIKAVASNQAVPIVNKTTFGETEIHVPSELSEQKKIGTYFRNLDHLITLHQRELEILKNLKKTCLKRMFI